MERFLKTSRLQTPGSLTAEVLNVQLARYSLQEVVYNNSDFAFRVDIAVKD